MRSRTKRRGAVLTATAAATFGLAVSGAPAALVNLPPGRSGRGHRLKGVDNRCDVRRIRPVRVRCNDLDRHSRVAQETTEGARKGDPPDHQHPIGQVGPQPLIGGEQQRTVRDDASSVMSTERLRDERPPGGSRQGCHVECHGGIRQIAKHHKGSGD